MCERTFLPAVLKTLSVQTALHIQVDACDTATAAFSSSALRANVLQFAANVGVSTAATDISFAVNSCSSSTEGTAASVNVNVVVQIDNLSSGETNAVSVHLAHLKCFKSGVK